MIVRDPAGGRGAAAPLPGPGGRGAAGRAAAQPRSSGRRGVGAHQRRGAAGGRRTRRLAVNLATGAQAVPATVLRATGAGRGVIRLEASGPGGFCRHPRLRPHRAAGARAGGAGGGRRACAGRRGGAGAGIRAFPPRHGACRGEFRRARYATTSAALVQALADYPISCLEQATSRGLPLAVLPDGPMAGPDRAGRLQAAVASVLDRQRYDGAFSLWTASGEAEPWLTPYAMEFLLRARAAGAAVPEAAIRDGLKALGEAADNEENAPPALAAQAYRLYVLAYAGAGPSGGGAGAGPADRQAADAAGPGATRRRAGAGARYAARRGRLRRRARCAGPALVGRATTAPRCATQAAIAVLLKESGLLPERLPAWWPPRSRGADLQAASSAPRSRPGRPPPPGCWAATAGRAHRAGRTRTAGAPVVTVAARRAGRCPQPGRPRRSGRACRSAAFRPRRCRPPAT